MTEKHEPDLEKTARAIVGWLYVPSDMADPAVEIPAAVTHVVERLRQVWNARGAADIQAIDVEAHRVHAEANRTGRTDLEIDTVAAIKALDR